LSYSIKDKISKLQGNQTADIRKPEMSVEDYYDDPLTGYSFNNKYNSRNSEIDISKPFYGVTIGDSFLLDSSQLEQFNFFSHAFSWVSALFGLEETPTQIHGTYVKLAYIDSSVSQEYTSQNTIDRKTLCIIDNTVFDGAQGIPSGKLVKVQFLDYNLTNARIIGIADRTSSYVDTAKALGNSLVDTASKIFDSGTPVPAGEQALPPPNLAPIPVGTPGIKDFDPKGLLNDPRLHPAVRAITITTGLTLQKEGYRPYLVETYRSAERQAQILRKGATKVSFSWHQTGLAVDIVHYNEKGTGPSWLQSNRPLAKRYWPAVGRAGKAAGFTEWGGDWKSFIDKVHLQFIPKHISLSRAKAILNSSGLEAVWKAAVG